ncbi:metalloprotease [Flavobacteriales bacterium 34_180_T64]|nr:metalloprotease [Flavobacteriales bacterium 34_180_T64]
MKLRHLILIYLFVTTALVYGQNHIKLKAQFDIPSKTIRIEQQITYQNTSKDTLNVMFLNDWNNAYSTKKTPLAKRFTEEFNNKFHFAKSEERGYTIITSIRNSDNDNIDYARLNGHPDIIKIELNTPLLPSQTHNFVLKYNIRVPDDTFTEYGISDLEDFDLKYWYITPAVYDGEWRYYSNKNLNDLYIPKANLTFQIECPINYTLTSELDMLNHIKTDTTQTVFLSGNNRVNTGLILKKNSDFQFLKTDKTTLITNIADDGLPPPEKAIITDNILNFVKKNLGAYPHKRLIVTETDYRKDPLYGLNQLPNFIRPFPDNFQYELKLLKTILNKHLENTLLLNPRKDYWLKDGLQIYFLMKYVEENYPDMKLLGTFSDIWGVRSFHISDLYFNSQYNLFYMQMARNNRDQSLTISKDSLLKFNANLAGKYKAGIGLKYLDDFVNSDVLEQTIIEYLNTSKLQLTSSDDFESLLNKNTNKNVDWFFTDYLNTRKKADFKIKRVIKNKDSTVTLTIKNKRQNSLPVSLFALNNDSIISKTWIENISKEKTITLPRNNFNKLVLNYDNVIPEINLRDNWKSMKGLFFNNKPLQFRFFKDIEDPNYNQVFFMPVVEYKNIYDGLTVGLKTYNSTLLRKRFSYKISPKYAFKSKSLTGSTTVSYTHLLENSNLYNVNYGIRYSYSSFAENAFVTRISPSLSFRFRDDSNFRSNKTQFLVFRYLDIARDIKENAIIEDLDEPDYGVFNARFVSSNPGLVDYSSWNTDFQLSKSFGKLGFNFEYRKLFESNRQFNFRFFTGVFLYNKTDVNSDYFSFALDRPTDYLFDYNYLGRSEDSGIFSQQIIIAEGGFKSKLDTPFANQWMSTINTSTTLWKYIEGYGDLGLVKNKNNKADFVYDSGIRLNLVTDYFEIYFPIYSNLGWEISQPHYDQKIRFKFTVDPQALLGLFRRKWY